MLQPQLDFSEADDLFQDPAEDALGDNASAYFGIRPVRQKSVDA